MPKETFAYEDFLVEANQLFPDSIPHVNRINTVLTENGCVIKLERSKSGFVVSYNKNKAVLMNFVFRKKGITVRIYGDFVNQYQQILEGFSTSMKKEIEKASLCKRLIDPAKCNPRCKMGFDFVMDGTHHQKCRYGGFMFIVNGENIDSIVSILENEIKCRAA